LDVFDKFIVWRKWNKKNWYSLFKNFWRKLCL